jgi:hypothetical protein
MDSAGCVNANANAIVNVNVNVNRQFTVVGFKCQRSMVNCQTLILLARCTKKHINPSILIIVQICLHLVTLVVYAPDQTRPVPHSQTYS